jgi:signal transduction histidine kinase
MNEASRAVVAALQRCLERYPDPTILVDAFSMVISQNSAAVRLFGDNVGRACCDGLRDVDDPSRVLPLTEVLSGRTHRGHLRQRSEDGFETFFEVTALPLESDDGSVFGASLLFRDVTLQLKHEHHLFAEAQDLEREIEAKTREVEELLRRADGLRAELDQLRDSQARVLYRDRIMTLGQLVAGVAHDIHTPLGALLSNAHLFQRSFAALRSRLEQQPAGTGDTSAMVDRLRALERSSAIIVEAGERIEKVVRRLRAFSRTDEAPEQLADLHECLDSAIELVTHQLGERVALRRSFGELPLVVCQPDALNQVFLNLLVNAIQAIDGPGEVAVETRSEEDQIEIVIRDSGHGIAPEHLERVFDPGFTTKQRGVGTGLGLAICRRIVSDQGGAIEIDSEIGRGTAVTVRLPHERSRSRPVEQESSP